MIHKQIFIRLIAVILVLFLITSCSAGAQNPLNPTSLPSITNTPQTKINPTSLPTLTSAGEATKVVEATTEKTNEPTLGSVPLIPSGEVITPKNAHELKELTYSDNSNVSGGDMGVQVAFSPNGEVLAAAYNPGPMILYDVATFEVLSKLETSLDFINRVIFSPDGKLVAAGGGIDPIAGGVQIWDVATQEQVLFIRDFENAVYAIEFSPNSTILASGEGNYWGGPGSSKLWDVATGELLSEFAITNGRYSFTVFDITFNPEGTLVATANSNGKVQFWDVANNMENKVMTGVAGIGFGVAFSPDGKLFAASGSKSRDTNQILDLRLWDLTTEELVFKVESPGWGFMRVTFSPNGQILATTMGESIGLWDIETGNTLATLPGGESAAFSPDGTLIAIGGGGIWGIPSH